MTRSFTSHLASRESPSSSDVRFAFCCSVVLVPSPRRSRPSTIPQNARRRSMGSFTSKQGYETEVSQRYLGRPESSLYGACEPPSDRQARVHAPKNAGKLEFDEDPRNDRGIGTEAPRQLESSAGPEGKQGGTCAGTRVPRQRPRFGLRADEGGGGIVRRAELASRPLAFGQLGFASRGRLRIHDDRSDESKRCCHGHAVHAAELATSYFSVDPAHG